MRLLTICSILFLIVSCGTREKVKQTQRLEVETKKIETIDFSIIDSMRSVIKNLFISQEFQQFELVRDSSGNVVRDKQGKPETYLNKSGKNEIKQEDKFVTKFQKADFKANKNENTKSKAKITQNKKAADSSIKNNF